MKFMKFWLRFLLLAVLITAVSACTSATPEETTTPEPSVPASSPTITETAVLPTDTTTPSSGENSLTNTAWTLQSFGLAGEETPVLEGTAVTLTFGPDGQAGGSGGCNSYGGDYQVQDGRLIFGEIASTLMACTEAGVTEQEQTYLEALRTAGEFEQTDDQLVIYYNESQGALNFVETSAAATPAAEPYPGPGSTAYPGPEDRNSLTGTQWRLESFGLTDAKMPVTAGSPVTLLFETASLVTGSGGCNSYGGDYTVQGDALSFNQIISTEMACGETAVTEQEQRFFDALQTAESFTQTTDRLSILYDDGQSVLNFVPASLSGGELPPEAPSRITFEPNTTSAELSNTIEEYDTHYYVLRALEGQEMTAEISSPNDDVVLSIVTEDGTPIKRYQNGPPASWTGTLPATQDYYIHATSFGPATSYTLYVQVDALESVTGERVEFTPGTASAQRNGSISAGAGTKQYVLAASAGQTLEVGVNSGSAPVSFTIVSPGGATWEAEQLGSEVYVFYREVTLPENGDYVVTLSKPESSLGTNYNAMFTIE